MLLKLPSAPAPPAAVDQACRSSLAEMINFSERHQGTWVWGLHVSLVGLWAAEVYNTTIRKPPIETP
jgi:hypothetical protein